MGLFGFGEKFSPEKKNEEKLEEALNDPEFSKEGLGDPTQDFSRNPDASGELGMDSQEFVGNEYSNKDIISGRSDVPADGSLAMEAVDGSELLQKEIAEESEGGEEEEGVNRAA